MKSGVVVLSRMACSDFLELTKPRINLLVLVTTWIGYALAPHQLNALGLLLNTLSGTACVVAGAGVLNQYCEWDLDAKMKRTAQRPLPSGRMHPFHALVFGVSLSIFGTLYLALSVNLLTSVLAILASITYVFVYTPLKTRTPLCTLAGAIPGAIPPLIGWAAVENALSFPAWLLFFIMFFWQLPHFLSLAALYRDDYAQAGLRMLSVDDVTGRMTIRQMMHYTLALVIVSLLPTYFGISGLIYFSGALLLGLGLFWIVFRCAFSWADWNQSQDDKALQVLRKNYRVFFHATILYLPTLFILMFLNH